MVVVLLGQVTVIDSRRSAEEEKRISNIIINRDACTKYY